MIHQLVYYSRNTVAESGRSALENLREIVSVSQKNNVRDGITGFLIFDKTWFVQILEGERSKVSETYQRIDRDPRHASATIMEVRDVPMRSFPNWTMGGALRTLDVQEIYLLHGIGGPLEPGRLKSAQVIQLALDLQAFEEAKRQPARRAS